MFCSISYNRNIKLRESSKRFCKNGYTTSYDDFFEQTKLTKHAYNIYSVVYDKGFQICIKCVSPPILIRYDKKNPT